MGGWTVTVALMLALATLAACSAPHPYIRASDANSVEINYAGDVSTTLPLATRHCAQFERLPRLADAGTDLAVYDCIRK